MKVSHVWL